MRSCRCVVALSSADLVDKTWVVMCDVCVAHGTVNLRESVRTYSFATLVGLVFLSHRQLCAKLPLLGDAFRGIIREQTTEAALSATLLCMNCVFLWSFFSVRSGRTHSLNLMSCPGLRYT